MANPISSLLVRIGADTSDLEAGGRRASKAMDDLGSKAAALGKKMAVLGAAAAAAGAAMVAGLVKSGLSAIDAQAKLARSLDASIDGLRGLQIASGDAGIGNEQLAQGLRNLNARLGEAMRGTGEAKKSLDVLGLSARALSQLDTDQRMAVIADRMRELGLSSAQSADVLRKLGFEHENFIPLMQAGGDAIRAARKEVDEYGLSLSEVDAAKVEQANDAMSRIGRVMESIRNKITVALAPLLQELADRFNDVSKANQGFGSTALTVTETVISGMAKLADVVHVVHTGFAALKVVAAGVSAAFWTVVEGIINTTKAVNEGLYAAINTATGAINRLAGTSIPPIVADTTALDNIAAVGGTARDMLYEARNELNLLASQDWPSGKVEEFLAAVRARAEEAAAAVAGVMGGGGNGSDPNADQEELEEHIKQLQERYALEQELKEANDAFVEEMERAHLDELLKIRVKGLSAVEKFTTDSFRNQVKTVSGYMADLTAGISRENKAAFEVNKVAGIANAIVATHQGMAEALKLGWPLGPIKAAAIGAAGFAQVSAIKSQSFGGGGGGTAAAPSLAGSTPATPVTPVGGGASERSVLTVEGIDPGSLFSGRAVRELAERLQEHMRDGGTVQFA